MNYMIPISFRLKTILGIALIEAILLLILIWNALVFLKTSNENELVKRARTTAALFATTTKDAVLSTDLASLESFVTEVMKNPDLVYARVWDTEQVLAEAGSPEVLARPIVRDESLDDVDDGIFDSGQDITEAGIVFGRVEIGISTEQLKTTFFRARQQVTLIAVIELALSTLFSVILGSYLVKGLHRLTEASRRICEGDLGFQVEVSGRDEIAVTAQAFNRMSVHVKASQEEIERQNEELRKLTRVKDALLQRTSEKNREVEEKNCQLVDLTETLEQKVEERTAWLDEKNRELNRVNGELQSALEDLKSTQEKLLQSEKFALVGQMSGIVAHEVLNPVSAIAMRIESNISYAKQCRKVIEKLNQSLKEVLRPAKGGVLGATEKNLAFIEKIGCGLAKNQDERLADLMFLDKQTSRVVKIVDGFRQRSKTRKEIEPMNLSELIRETLEDLEEGLEKRGIEVTHQLEKVPVFHADSMEIYSVVSNLLRNAMQAIDQTSRPAKKQISVNLAWNENNQAIILVRDTGIGVAEDHWETIFEAGFTTKGREGTGLGLSLCRKIVRSYQGDLSVLESEQGRGTTFQVVLPLNGPQTHT